MANLRAQRTLSSLIDCADYADEANLAPMEIGQAVGRRHCFGPADRAPVTTRALFARPKQCRRTMDVKSRPGQQSYVPNSTSVSPTIETHTPGRPDAAGPCRNQNGKKIGISTVAVTASTRSSGSPTFTKSLNRYPPGP